MWLLNFSPFTNSVFVFAYFVMKEVGRETVCKACLLENIISVDFINRSLLRNDTVLFSRAFCGIWYQVFMYGMVVERSVKFPSKLLFRNNIITDLSESLSIILYQCIFCYCERHRSSVFADDFVCFIKDYT